MSQLTGFLESVDFKATSKPSEWVGVDWECDRPLLYFNVEKEVGFCLYCNKTRTLREIAQQLAGIHPKDIDGFLETHQSNERRIVGFKDAMEEGLLSKSSIQAEKPLKELEWPEGCRNLDEGRNSVEGKKAFAYLAGRGFDMDWVAELQFGYCTTGYFEGRIIVPTLEDGKLVYYQGRDYTGKKSPKEKVLNPSLKVVPNGKTEVLFNYDEAQQFDHIAISESWGSTLAMGRNCVGINGQRLSQRQLFKLLKSNAESFLVLLDYGADSFAWSIAETLNKHRPTWIGFLPEGDPNSVLNTVLNESISTAVRYSKEEHIKLRISQATRKITQFQKVSI